MEGNRFVDAGGDAAAFVDRGAAMHQWVRDRLQLCGGWSPELDRQYAPRLYGYYQFSAECSVELRQMAQGLMRLYRRLGSRFGELLREHGLPEHWPLDRFGRQEAALINAFRHQQNWATTLRADIVLDATGQPRIVEVNSDNVGGLEDLLMMLGYFCADAPPDDPKVRALEQLKRCYLEWLRRQYAAWLHRCGRASRALEQSSIALVADDLENSSALTRILAAFLRSQGIRAQPCRPRHLRRHEGGLQISDELGDRWAPVDFILRDMLWQELFDVPDADADKTLKPQMSAMLEAARRDEVLLLNPPSERLLFSKAILAELCTGRHGLFQLDDTDREFVDRWIAKTDYFDASTQVLKPSSLFGGQDVLMPGGPAAIGQRAMPWVTQARIETERIRTFYRGEPEQAPELRDLYVVHGLVLYGAPGDELAEAAGVMTRIGPQPVVNFSRGAQIVPGILT